MKTTLFTLLMITFLMFPACKKGDEPKPAQQTPPSGSTTQKYNYRYNYKKPSDTNVYQATGCYTPAEISSLESANGWFNVVTLGPC